MNDNKNIESAMPETPAGDHAEDIGARDVFLQLLAMVTLYLSAIAFGTLLFQFINIWIPDPLEGVYGASGRSGAIRFAMASLLVVFPVYAWVTSYIRRNIKRIPARSDLKSRKWLLNFTLFATAVIIIVDLVMLVYRYLGGDISLRFVLKVLVVLAIAAAIFAYYLMDIRTRGRGGDTRMRLLARGVIGIVAIATIGGFVLAGSPQRARREAVDARRVQHLQEIQWQVVSYWQDKGALPATLADLTDPLRGWSAPKDPETGEPYEYQALGDLTFELCATFITDASGTEINGRYAAPVEFGLDENWAHGIGRVCFEREIDPDIYRKNPASVVPVPKEAL